MSEFFKPRGKQYRPRSAGRRLREWMQRRQKREEKIKQNVEDTLARLGYRNVMQDHRNVEVARANVMLTHRENGTMLYFVGRYECKHDLRSVWLTPERAQLCKRSGKVHVERAVIYR